MWIKKIIVDFPSFKDLFEPVLFVFNLPSFFLLQLISCSDMANNNRRNDSRFIHIVDHLMSKVNKI